MATDLAVVGLGYVGLPLASEAVRSGLSVLGIDVSPAVVDWLNSGVSHIDDVSDSDIRAMCAAGFRASTDDDLDGADTVIVCVPTPLTEERGPDLSAVRAAMVGVAEHLRPGMLVVLESTTYPGTTDEVVRPLLEVSGSSPASISTLRSHPSASTPATRSSDIRNTPKIVGGHTPQCDRPRVTLLRAVCRHRRSSPWHPRGGDRQATGEHLPSREHRPRQRDGPVLSRAEHRPVGRDPLRCHRSRSDTMPFYPGPGVGGHCIPIDPNFLSHNVRARLGYPFRFVELAQEINAAMPAYVVQRAQEVLNADRKSLNGATVLLLGVTYKADIADQRESPAVPLARQLVARGASVAFHDPYLETWQTTADVRERVDDLDTSLVEADLTILLQGHSSYDLEQLATKARRILDTRGVVPAAPSVEHL